MERSKIIDQNHILYKEDGKRQTCYRETYFSYEVGKFCKLDIQGSRLGALLRTLTGHFPNLRSVANRFHTHHSMPVDYRCATQHAIGSVRSLFIKISFYNGFGNNRLTRKIGFVYLQGNGFQQLTVGRDLLTGFQNYNITDYHLLTGNLLYTPITDNLY